MTMSSRTNRPNGITSGERMRYDFSEMEAMADVNLTRTDRRSTPLRKSCWAIKNRCRMGSVPRACAITFVLIATTVVGCGTAHRVGSPADPTLLGDGPNGRLTWQVRPASIAYTGDGSGILGGFDGTGIDHAATPDASAGERGRKTPPTDQELSGPMTVCRAARLEPLSHTE
jgi:hypothetical protein